METLSIIAGTLFMLSAIVGVVTLFATISVIINQLEEEEKK